MHVEAGEVVGTLGKQKQGPGLQLEIGQSPF